MTLSIFLKNEKKYFINMTSFRKKSNYGFKR